MNGTGRLRGTLARHEKEVPEFSASELARLIAILETAAVPDLEQRARDLYQDRLRPA